VGKVGSRGFTLRTCGVHPAEGDWPLIGSGEGTGDVLGQPHVVHPLHSVLPKAEALVAAAGSLVRALSDDVHLGIPCRPQQLQRPQDCPTQQRECHAPPAVNLRCCQKSDVYYIVPAPHSNKAYLLPIPALSTGSPCLLLCLWPCLYPCPCPLVRHEYLVCDAAVGRILYPGAEHGLKPRPRDAGVHCKSRGGAGGQG